MKTFCQNNTSAIGARVKKLSALFVFLVSTVLAVSIPALATIDNNATATGNYGAQVVISDPDLVQVPVTGGAVLQVTKEADDDTDVVVGQVVTYTYVVRNAGDLTLTNVSLNDVHNGSGPAPIPNNEGISVDAGTQNDSTDVIANDGIWSILAPGDEITLTATYVVTQGDIDTKQ